MVPIVLIIARHTHAGLLPASHFIILAKQPCFQNPVYFICLYENILTIIYTFFMISYI